MMKNLKMKVLTIIFLRKISLSKGDMNEIEDN